MNLLWLLLRFLLGAGLPKSSFVANWMGRDVPSSPFGISASSGFGFRVKLLANEPAMPNVLPDRPRTAAQLLNAQGMIAQRQRQQLPAPTVLELPCGLLGSSA